MPCSALVRDPDLLFRIIGRRAREIAELGLDDEPGELQQMPHFPPVGPAQRQLEDFLLRDRPLIREGAITPQVMTDLVDVIEPDRFLNRLDLPAGTAVGADLAIEWGPPRPALEAGDRDQKDAARGCRRPVGVAGTRSARRADPLESKVTGTRGTA